MVEVAEIVTEVSGYLHFGPPKIRAGYRRVGLPRVVVEALAEQLARPGSADDLVFVGPQGGTLRLAGFRHRIWRPATRAAGLEGLRIHDLRHTAVALWSAAGANPKEVAARAGHFLGQLHPGPLWPSLSGRRSGAPGPPGYAAARAVSVARISSP